MTLVSVDVIAKVGGSAGGWTAFKEGERFTARTDNVTGTFYFGD